MTIEDSIWFYEHQVTDEQRSICEEKAIKRAFEDLEINKNLNFPELKVRYYLQNLVEAYKEMLG